MPSSLSSSALRLLDLVNAANAIEEVALTTPATLVPYLARLMELCEELRDLSGEQKKEVVLELLGHEARKAEIWDDVLPYVDATIDALVLASKGGLALNALKKRCGGCCGFWE